jgi:hypothetical protein
MGCDVYANSNAISCKAGDGKAIAAFPDVCLSPPSPPAGPVPVPYPNTSFDKDMQNGSKTVMIKGQEVMLKDQSFYKTSPLGDEAATNSFGGSVVTHVITGKTYFLAWSMDVQFEGQNVDRNLDITGSNCASPPSTPPDPATIEAAKSTDKKPKCECCDGDAHSAAQASGDPKKKMTQDEFYHPKIDKPTKDEQKMLDESEAIIDLVKNGGDPPGKCAGSLPPDPPGKCGQHYISSPPEKKESDRLYNALVSPLTPDEELKGLGGSPQDMAATRARLVAAKKGSKYGAKIAHQVPRVAGGCPIGDGNLHAVTDPDCQYLEDQLGHVQEKLAKYHRARLGV